MSYNFNILASEDPLSHVVQHDLMVFNIAGHEIHFTNHMLMVLVAFILLLGIIPVMRKRGGMIPSGLANFIEAICVFLRDEVAKPALHEDTDRFIKYIWTVFFFVLTLNLMGMVPTASIIYFLSGKHLKDMGGTATANIWVTGTLALCSFLMIHIAGIMHQGPVSYFKNFVPAVPKALIPFMYVLELAGSIIKPFALAVRLFANMLAGHTVIGALIVIGMASQSYIISSLTLAGCVALSLIDLFVSFLQAYIFTFLTVLFISSAVHPEH
ncbi:MAG: F0F1 ATP synthase subunit A [Phycisphaerae bacterium]|nr:F0F1 ATP synthase subunit A [Phycisphaerae bacterium]